MLPEEEVPATNCCTAKAVSVFSTPVLRIGIGKQQRSYLYAKPIV